MPGVLGLDGIFQRAGFVLAWSGARGDGMALGFGGGKFRGKVTPDSHIVGFRVDVKRLKFPSALSVIRVDGKVTCDGKPVSMVEDFEVGVAARKLA